MPDDVIEVRDNTNRVLNVGTADLGICRDSIDAALTKSVAGIHKKIDGFEGCLRNNRFHDIQLKLPGFSSHCHSLIISDDLKADLVDDLGNNRVHLRRHDRRTCSHLRKINFIQTSAWSRSKQTKIITNL